MTNVKLDWDAQKWKAPTYLMEDRAFDGVVGVGAAAAGGTVGALALGPAINRVLAQSFAQLSRRVATSLGTRLAFAQQGAWRAPWCSRWAARWSARRSGF